MNAGAAVVGGALCGLLLGWYLVPVLGLYVTSNVGNTRLIVGEVLSHNQTARTILLKEKVPSPLLIKLTYDENTVWSEITTAYRAGAPETSIRHYAPADLVENAHARIRFRVGETFHADDIVVQSS